MNCLSHEREMKRATNSGMSAIADSQPTRRNFLATLAAASATIGSLSMFGAAAISSEAAPSQAASSKNVNDTRFYGVVSFHMDQPYLDTTGTAIPYHPPSGARSAASAADLSEIAFRAEHCYA